MQFDPTVSAMNIHAITLMLAASMLLAWQAGWLMGRRSKHPMGSKFDDAAMALLTLVLAFSFAAALAKHDQRRLGVVGDANAIGDFYTCASLIEEPVRGQLQQVIRHYAELRLKLARGPLSSQALADALASSARDHRLMTTLVAQALANGTPVAVSLTNTLNAVSSNQAVRLSAYRDRMPASAVILLFSCAAIAVFLVGREQGNVGSTDAIATLCFILLVTVAVYVVLDLNQPESGLIRVSQEPMERVLASIGN